ncbi:DUF1302 domain-containing protein [Pyruvatibacter sp.]|uniref:DUF1302 domain-containing protein n=1 Tax=Pyruvatibacter sp. TaxID=1981328 RepID=UPI0032F040A9
MTTRNLRSALLGSAVGAGLLISGGQAHALSTELGEVKIFFDTTVSVGVQMKTKDARKQFLTEFNGGNFDPRENSTRGVSVLAPAGTPNILGAFPATATPVTSTDNTAFFGPAGTAVPFNFDDSANTDDRFLNFGAGDLTSANIKANHDLQVTWRNFTLFARATEFYDAVLNSDGSYNRFGIDDNNREEVGRDIRLLDLYLSADFDLASLPVNFRAGKQVISWGEGTFIFNGINAFNPVDVSTFRRPGVEIKEGLIPVWALYGSVGLPFDLSLEAFYQLDWEPFQLDPAGTPFAGSDVANANSSFGGNQGVGFYSGSIRGGANLRNCDAANNPTLNLVNSGLVTALSAGTAAPAYATLVGTGCTTASSQHYLTNLPTDGSAQGILLNGYRDGAGGIVDERGNPRTLEGTSRGRDIMAKDSGQWGVALRYYSEALNSTEFGFYYMNYHSRLPIAQVKPDGIAEIETSITAPGSAGTNLASGVGACGALAGAGVRDFADTSLQSGGFLQTINVNDPNQTAAAFAPTARAVYGALGNATAIADLASITAGSATINMRQAALIKCAITLGTSIAFGPAGLTPDGVENIAVTQNLSTTLIYPEDIEMWGMSFNTTIGDWGVQGEFSFRPNQPLQVDTTQQTISAAGAQCVGSVTFGDLLRTSISPLSTEPGTQPLATDTTGCNPANFGRTPTAFVREEVFTFQIGTTATYTNSNPLINFLGADIGILVTEFGLVHIPGVPDESPINQTVGNVVEFNRLAELCRSGTNLPLGAILSLDSRTGCSPTETSYGGILLTRLDYNNAFGTPWTLSPQIVYRHDLEGLTPAPLGNFVEDRKSVGLSLTANLQNVWTVGLSYTDFMGSETYQQDLDDDFVSLTASYSF